MSKKKNHESEAIKRLLFEAYRRSQMFDPFERGKPILYQWLGLGCASAYKPALEAGLMRWVNGRAPAPRCAGWLQLTEAGLEVFNANKPQMKKILDQMKADGYERTLRSRFMLMGELHA